MNWAAIITLAIKYGPAIIAFEQAAGPQIQSFIADIEAALKANTGPFAFLPVALKYAPVLTQFAQAHQVDLQGFITDLEATFHTVASPKVLTS